MNKGIVWLGFEFLLKGICSLLTIYLLSYYLKQADFGELKYVISIASLISAISLSGLASTIIRNISKHNYCIISQILKKYMTFSILTLVVLLITCIFTAKFENYRIATTIFTVGTIIIINNAFLLYESILIGKLMFKVKFLMSSFNSIVTLSTLTYLILKDYSINHLIHIPLIVTMVNNIIYFIFTAAYTKNTFNNDTNVDKNEQYHLSFIKIIQRIGNEIDQIILYQLMGPNSLATYSVAATPVKKISSLSVIVKNYILPKLCSMNIQQSSAYIKKILIKSIVPAIVLVVGYNFFAFTMFDLIFPKYQHAKTLTQLFSIVFIFIFPISIFSQLLIAEMDLNKLYTFSITIPVTKIILLFVLITKFDVLGAVISILIMSMISLSLYIFFFYKLKAKNSETLS